jgi:MYXO-CTERM domain-containing protein
MQFMNRHSRILIALFILLSGLALVPQINLYAGVVSWQRFAGGYEDVVTVTLVRYLDNATAGGNLEVRATNTAGGNATLTVWRASDNAFIGTMTYTGSDHYGLFAQEDNPEFITVRSSAGGSTTVPVPEVPTAIELSTIVVEQNGPDWGTGVTGVALTALAGLAVFALIRRR